MIELRIPKEHANDDQVLVAKILVKSNEIVTEGQELIEIETSKTTIVLDAPSEGVVEILVTEDQEIAVNSVYCHLHSDLKWSNAESGNSSESVKEKSAEEYPTDQNISDTVKALIKDDPSIVDTENKWITSRALKANSSKETNIIDESPDSSKSLLDVELKYSSKRTSIRKRTEIGALRSSGGGPFQSVLGINIQAGRRRVKNLLFDKSLQDIVCYEAAKLLDGEFHDLNGFYISDSEIGIYDDINAGISLDNHSNLVVARVENAANLSLHQVQNKLADLYTKFEDGELDQSDLMPTTFTISDLSNSSCTYMLPLLNGHQALILGIVRQAKDFNIYAAFDHRVSEGLRVSKFLDALKQRCELHFNPIDAQVQCSFCQKTLEEEALMGNKDRGFIQLMSDDGMKLCCRTCFDGW
jgi:pyruvate/2-oxoglutarate dehydrogenase complex dihydrolipoamide acyltransferase (E2) component